MWEVATPATANEIYEASFTNYCEMFDELEEAGNENMIKALIMAFGNSI